MNKVLLSLILLPGLAFAQIGTLVVGELNIPYDTTVEVDEGVLYYEGGALVASEHDAITIVYENDVAVLEAHDTDEDGTLDAFLTLDTNDEVIDITGAAAGKLTRPEVVAFADLQALEGDADGDLVGSLDSITIPSYHNYTLYILILLLIGGGYWYYRKHK